MSIRTVRFTEDQFQTVYRFVNANQHRNKDLPEVAAVLEEANHWVTLQDEEEE